MIGLHNYCIIVGCQYCYISLKQTIVFDLDLSVLVLNLRCVSDTRNIETVTTTIDPTYGRYKGYLIA